MTKTKKARYLCDQVLDLANALDMTLDFEKIARVLMVAEKVSRAECGYTEEDLIEELVNNKGVRLHKDEWDTVLHVLDCGGSIEIHDKIKEQL